MISLSNDRVVFICSYVVQTGPHKNTIRTYIEVDFAEITTKKSMNIKKNKELVGILGNPDQVKLGRGPSTSTMILQPHYMP